MTKSLLLKESEMLKQHLSDCFVVINNSINISDLTLEHSSELSQIIKSAIEKANTEVQGTITQILAKMLNLFKNRWPNCRDTVKRCI